VKKMTKANEAEKAQTLGELKALLAKASTADGYDHNTHKHVKLPVIYTALWSVSASGMSRRISAFVVVDGDITKLDWYVLKADITGTRPRGDNDGVVLGGCGMDMGYHLAYSIGQAIYGDGYKVAHRWL